MTPSSTPILVYDDDCGFCTRAALYVERHADVDLAAFSDLDEDLRARLPEDWRDCAHLVTDDAVYSCGEAMERAYELTDRPLSTAPRWLRRAPGYERARERGYRWIANHRPLVSRVTRRWL